MGDIHQTAIVEDGARIGAGVRIGAYAIVERDVVLEDGVVVHPHVVVSGKTTDRRRHRALPVRRGRRAAAGHQLPAASRPPSSSAPNCIIREHATVNRGTARGRGETRIGANCFLMIGCSCRP